MAWWTGLLKREGRKQADPLELFRQIYGGAASASGVTITAKTALQCGVAFACARVIAEGLSQVPFRLMVQEGQNRNAAKDHPLWDLFTWSPNEWQTATDFVDQLAMHLVFCGNAFVWKSTMLGKVVEMLPLEPGSMRVQREDYRLRYFHKPEGSSEIEIPAAEMWHIRGPSWNGWMGLDAVKLAREAIGLSIAAEGHGAGTFANGATVAGILTTAANLTPEQREGLRESFQKVHGGQKNAGKVAVMSNGMTFVEMANNNVDSQWIESRKFQIEEVCRPFRVMPIMVGYSDKTATYASAEQMFLAHVVHTLGPWYARLEQSAAVNLLTPNERANGYYFKFFTQALLRGAVKDRGEFYTKLYNVGAINPNQIRELEDMNPYEGGDQYRVPLNMVDPAAPVITGTNNGPA